MSTTLPTHKDRPCRRCDYEDWLEDKTRYGGDIKHLREPFMEHFVCSDRTFWRAASFFPKHRQNCQIKKSCTLCQQDRWLADQLSTGSLPYAELRSSFLVIFQCSERTFERAIARNQVERRYVIQQLTDDQKERLLVKAQQNREDRLRAREEYEKILNVHQPRFAELLDELLQLGVRGKIFPWDDVAHTLRQKDNWDDKILRVFRRYVLARGVVFAPVETAPSVTSST